MSVQPRDYLYYPDSDRLLTDGEYAFIYDQNGAGNMKVNIARALKKIEPRLAEIGFTPDPEWTMPKKGAWSYVRKAVDPPQGISFFRSKWGRKVTAELINPGKLIPAARIGELSDYREDYWWRYDSQESLEKALDEIMALVVDRGERWFRGEIDLEEWIRRGTEG